MNTPIDHHRARRAFARVELPAVSRRGFTLVELLIVVAVIAVVVNLSLPMFGSSEAAKLTAAATMVEADLAFAQVESIAHGDDPRIVVFDTTNHRYHIAAASDTATPITHPVTKKPYLVQFGEGNAERLASVTISAVSIGGDDELGFGMYGQLDQTTDATVTLANNAGSITLTLDDATGEVTIGDIN